MASEDILIDVGVSLGNSVSELGKFNNQVDKTVGNVSKGVGPAGGFFGALKGGVGSIVGMVNPLGLAVAGVGALVGGLGAATKAAADEAVGVERMNQALKNSIPDWNGNTNAVEAYISKQEKLAFADDELRDSLAHLVGQTKNLGEAQSLQATAMDLARAKGISLEAATKAVGKVDQESIGILKKLGIQVTENMTKEEALTAIRQASAGQAEAYAGTAAGSMERLQTTFGNIVENIGGVLLPIITDALGGIADFVSGESFQGALTTGMGLLTGLFDIMGTTIKTVFDIVGPIAGMIGEFVAAVQGGADPLQSFGDLVGNIGTHLGDLIGKVLQAVGDALPGILTKLGEWATAFIAWIGPMIPPFLLELGKLLLGIGTWIVTEALPTIVGKLIEWAGAFIGWIAPMIPPALVELGKLLVGIGTWIVTDALPAIIKKLGEWAGAFLGWVGKDVVPEIGKKLMFVWLEIQKWAFNTERDIKTEIAKWPPAFLSFVTTLITDLGTKLGEVWTAITTWIGTTASNIGTEAKKIGVGIIDGIKQGFDDMWVSLKTKLQGIIDGLLNMMPDWLRDWLGIGGGKSGQTTGGGDSFSRGAPPIGGSPIGGHSFGGGGGGGQFGAPIYVNLILDGKVISQSVGTRIQQRAVSPSTVTI